MQAIKVPLKTRIARMTPGQMIGFGIMAAGLFMGDSLLYILGATPDEGVVFDMAKSYVFYILLGIPFQILLGVVTAYLRN